METQRSFLFIALMVVSFLLFQQWQLDNAPITPDAANSPVEQTNINNSSSDFVPEPSSSAAPIVKAIATNAKIITVTTDVFTIQINTQGGDIVDVSNNKERVI